MSTYINVKDAAKLYYLLMIADGECSKPEEEKFNLICHTLRLEEQEKKEAIKFCEAKIKERDRDFKNIKLVIDEILDIRSGNVTGFSFDFSMRKIVNGSVLWTMINLGYSDQDFSEIEKNIIHYLVQLWQFDEVFFADMMDTAETILSLVDHKEWIKSSNKGYDTIHKRLVDMDRKIDELYKNIQLNISEIEIV